LAIRDGQPFEPQLRAFEAFIATCFVLSFDQESARVAGAIWSAVARSRRHQWEDVLIAAIAISRGLPLVTRNRRDFEQLADDAGLRLELTDWTKPRRSTGGAPPSKI
jgi:predicted nucleic acid-binding protein